MQRLQRTGSLFLPFSFSKANGGVIKRYEMERFQPHFLEELRSHKKARMVICSSVGKANPEVLLAPRQESFRNEHPAFHSLHHLQPSSTGDLLFLGEDSNNRFLFLAPTKSIRSEYISSGTWVCSRELFSCITDGDLNAVGIAVSVEQWKTSTRFCSSCGAAFDDKNFVEDHFDCGRCKRRFYLTMTPAVIITVLDGHGSVLLCQNTRRPLSPSGKPLLTIIAGFVSTGETLEEAVVREVEEESSALVTQLTYVGSQPYPFPAQMMSCYYGIAESSTPIRPQEGEIMQVRWVTKREVNQALQGEHPQFSVPPRYTATHSLLTAWVDGLVDDNGNLMKEREKKCKL